MTFERPLPPHPQPHNEARQTVVNQQLRFHAGIHRTILIAPHSFNDVLLLLLLSYRCLVIRIRVIRPHASNII